MKLMFPLGVFSIRNFSLYILMGNGNAAIDTNITLTKLIWFSDLSWFKLVLAGLGWSPKLVF